MITITIDNYEKQKFIYTMPDTATIEIISENRLDENGKLIKIGLNIDVNCSTGIEVIRKDLKE